MSRLRVLSEQPELLPGVLAGGVLVAWAAGNGGSSPTSLYPGGLFLAALLAITAFVYGRAGLRLPRATTIAVTLLGCYVVWSFLSIGWAAAKGDAWEGANRALVYWSVFALFAIPSWRPRSAMLLMAAFSWGVAAVGGITFHGVAVSSDPSLSFLDGSLVDPAGYHNATAALFLGAAWPSLLVVTRRRAPWPARAISLACAGLLVELAIMAQSRGSTVALGIALVAFIVLVPGRLRTVAALVPLVATVALAAPPLLHVYTAITEGGDVAAAIDSADRALWISFGALLVVGGTLAYADRRARLPAPTARAAERATGLALISLAGAALVAFLIVVGNPVDWAQARWDDFKGGYTKQALTASTRFTSGLGSNRYDFWRVALDEFSDSPVAGVGADNFGVDYLQERRSDEEPQYAHSLPISVLAETGLVGVALFGGFLIAAVAAAVGTLRRASTVLTRAVVATVIAGSVYWFAHSAGDWLWQFPAFTAPALAWLALAGRLREEDATTPVEAGGEEPAGDDDDGDPLQPAGRASWTPGRIGAAAAVAVALAVAAASYGLPWIAARDVNDATSSWQADPSGAYRLLDDAHSLNFLDDGADTVGGTIALRRGDLARARVYFNQALERDSQNWYTLLELGSLDSVAGDWKLAQERIGAARALDPRDPLIRSSLARVKERSVVSPQSIYRSLVERVCQRVGQTSDTRFCG